MAINPYHVIDEIDGVRCSVVEKDIAAERAAFVKNILEKSGYEVKQRAEANGNFTIAVTDVLFNKYYAIYGRFLRNDEGKVVTMAMWNQKPEEPVKSHGWQVRHGRF
jgi:hypothetical protein